MTFLLPFMLAGLALTALPVLLHLIMRQQPKQLQFPAFRFLKQLHRTNQRKLRLRHLLLLAMRILLIAALCLALARPRVLSEKLHLAGEQPVAAVIVVDTSPSMEYVAGGKSRLDDAKQRINELLAELAEGSEVAVIDTADLTGGDWLPPKVAGERVGAMTVRAGSESVTRAIARAYGLFQERDAGGASPGQPDANLPRFLYVFSDRTVNCWDAAQLDALKAQRDRMAQPAAGAFIDVGVDNPVDLAVVDVEPVRQAVPANQPVTLRVTVRALGQPADTQVACRIADRAAAKPIKLTPGQSQTVEFTFTDLPTGYHQAEVALPTHDSLPFNDVRFVTVEVRPAREVLVITDDPAQARTFQSALNFHNLFRAEVRRTAEAAGMAPADLAKYKVIALLDVARPDEPAGAPLWERLRGYVASGGSLAVVPGGNELDSRAYNDNPTAQELLPGRLDHLIEPLAEGKEEGTLLDWDGSGYQHPFLAPFKRDDERNDVDYFKRNPPRSALYWAVKSYDAQNVILRHADAEKPDERRPALLERTFKGPDGKARGKVLLFTTPLDQRKVSVPLPDGASRQRPCNNFLESSFYLVLVNRAVSYLAGDFEDAALNFRAGPEVSLPLPLKPRFRSYALEGPGVTGSDTVVTADEKKDAKGKPTGEIADELRIRATGTAGNFTVRGTKEQGKPGGPESWLAKFSLNPAPAESLLDRVPVDSIEPLLGPGSVVPVGQKKSLHEALQNRFTQPVELFPWLMMLLLLVLAVENLLANKFYKARPPGEEDQGPPPVPVVTP
jgi:hypothetical protein